MSSNAIDGHEASRIFDALVRKVLSVPHEEIMRREEAYKKSVLRRPKRGPKPKTSASARVKGS